MMCMNDTGMNKYLCHCGRIWQCRDLVEFCTLCCTIWQNLPHTNIVPSHENHICAVSCFSICEVVKCTQQDCLFQYVHLFWETESESVIVTWQVYKIDECKRWSCWLRRQRRFVRLVDVAAAQWVRYCQCQTVRVCSWAVVCINVLSFYHNHTTLITSALCYTEDSECWKQARDDDLEYGSTARCLVV